ncbi:MAG: hypothetical protein D8M59_08070 [Planctomycetes bacterium]|nr:hypothetical protein [Planctomycetota bacterium]NOG53280.1 hypothetical protein [Planctomycetota bacterium]
MPGRESTNGIVRFLGSYLPGSMSPFLSRNYRYELFGVTTWPITVCMVEGAVTGVIARKAFPETPGWVLATVTAAPVVSNVTSSVWTRLADGQQTVKALVMMQAGVIALIGLIACLPLNHWGVYPFMVAVVLARMLMAGVVTMRSVIWRANYPRACRATVTGKLITIQTIIVSVVSLGLGRSMDANVESFRIVYPAAMLCGLGGMWAFSRIRVRRPFEISGQPSADRESRRAGSMVPFGLLAEWGTTVGAMMRVLRDDVAFRGYMVCMFVMGMSNLAVQAPLVDMAAGRFNLSYTMSIVCTQSLPLIIIPFVVPLWSRLFDRMHVVRFRSIHSWVFVTAHLLTYAAGRWESPELLFAAQAMRGIGFGGGALAWNIGHNDFSSTRNAGLYMTIHVTLTGIRGLIGAYVGWILYSGITIGGFVSMRALDHDSFLFWAGIGSIGALGFVYLNRRLASVVAAGPSQDGTDQR